jgi:hypothetical protein
MSEENQEPEELMDIIAKYAKEYGEDTRIDELRLREMLLKMAGIKGKWISYKAYNKAALIKLKRRQERILDEGVDIVKQQHEDAGHPILKKGAEEILKNSKKYKEITHKVENLTALVEYFSDSVYAIQNINWDIKNLIETIKIDEM